MKPWRYHSSSIEEDDASLDGVYLDLDRRSCLCLEM